MGLSTGLAKASLPVLATIGVLGTYKLAMDNGFLAGIQHDISAKSPTLPDSYIPLHTRYTGIPAVDKMAALFVSFFWSVLDGRSPTTTLQGTHFLGQGIAVWCLFLVESYRVSNTWRLISFATITGLLVENVLMALIVPLYCLLHLMTSPTALAPAVQLPATRKRSLLVHPAELKVMPWSIVLGCGVPTLFILLSESGSQAQQIWVAVRQIHPLLTCVFHLILSFFVDAESSFGTSAQRDRVVLRSLQNMYSFATYIAVIPHIGVLTLILLSQTIPTMFGSEYKSLFQPYAVFWPSQFWNAHSIQPATTGHGALMFLQWDELVGVGSVLVWAMALNRQALSQEPGAPGFLRMIFKVVLMTIVGGPAAAAISLIKDRDSFILDLPDVAEAGKKD